MYGSLDHLAGQLVEEKGDRPQSVVKSCRQYLRYFRIAVTPFAEKVAVINSPSNSRTIRRSASGIRYMWISFVSLLGDNRGAPTPVLGVFIELFAQGEEALDGPQRGSCLQLPDLVIAGQLHRGVTFTSAVRWVRPTPAAFRYSP
jgi:hypothetical protein